MLDIKLKYPEKFLYPGEIIIEKEPTCITTVLGSCISVCLFDKKLKFGGVNHYLLPEWPGEERESANRYGNMAIKELVDGMLVKGSFIHNLQAKVFGGVTGKNFATAYRIGDKNIELALKMLAELEIPVLAKNVGGTRGRKIHFINNTGEVFMKYLNN